MNARKQVIRALAPLEKQLQRHQVRAYKHACNVCLWIHAHAIVLSIGVVSITLLARRNKTVRRMAGRLKRIIRWVVLNKVAPFTLSSF